MTQNALDVVLGFQKDIILLRQIYDLLQWDQITYMPTQGIFSRFEHLGVIQVAIHQKMQTDAFYHAACSLRASNTVDPVMVNRVIADIEKARKIPLTFVERFTKHVAVSADAWMIAKREDDLEMFIPYLTQTIELLKEKTRYLDFDGHPYNGLLDDFEPGFTYERLQPLLVTVRDGVLGCLQTTKDYQRVHPMSRPCISYGVNDRSAILEYCRGIASQMGFDRKNINMSYAAHPFSKKIGKKDCRITIGMSENPGKAVISTLHEAGHALHDYNLPLDLSDVFIGQIPSIGLYESQSRFWDMCIGKSFDFWRSNYRQFQQQFQLHVGIEDFVRQFHLISTVPVRRFADEISYPLHIILRAEIEASLIDGTIGVNDIRKVWDQRCQEYFGRIPKRDSEGVLSDIHWGVGYVGYFPTYLIGSIYASQLYNAMKRDIPNMASQIRTAQYSMIRDWLKTRVHSKGFTKDAEHIIKDACGEGLNAQYYLAYLTHCNAYNMSSY